MFVTNWISPTKIQKISEITNFFRHYFLSRTEVLFIELRGISGTLTAFLGLFTDFKRKLDLAVVAMPPKAGMRMR